MSTESLEQTAATVPTTLSNSHYPSMWVTSLIVAESAALATVITKSLLHPLDTIKCRRQALRGSLANKNIFVAYRGKWSLSHLYGGLPIKLAFYLPYQVTYMTAYTAAHEWMDKQGRYREDNNFRKIATCITGAIAAEFSSASIRVPMEAVKMRIQSNRAHNTSAALSQLYRNGVWNCIKLSIPQTLCHDVPYSCIQWICYEYSRPWVTAVVHRMISDGQEGVVDGGNTSSRTKHFMHDSQKAFAGKSFPAFISGGISGFVACMMTLPMDTIKTRIVVSAAHGGCPQGMAECGWGLYKEGGVSALYRGGAWRVLWITSNMAVYFSLFESLRDRFS